MRWNKLPKEQSIAIMRTIGDQKDSVIFSEEMTDVEWQDLPFYRRFKLYRITNYATMPSFSMEFLGDGETFLPLDGTANSVYTANEKDPIKMNISTVTPYLDFFFSYVRAIDGDIFLVKDPNDLPLIASLNADQKQNILNHHKPLEINTHVTQGHFHVEGTLYYDGSLIGATIHIADEGKLSIENQSLLLQGLHFPHGPTSHNWGQQAQSE